MTDNYTKGILTLIAALLAAHLILEMDAELIPVAHAGGTVDCRIVGVRTNDALKVRQGGSWWSSKPLKVEVVNKSIQVHSRK
jgi:hypothetical protein